jgi:hypothetical protein
MRFGVAAGELNALVEQEYVRATVRQLAERGELVTASRISVMTGLPRNIVASIVASLNEESSRRVSSLIQRGQRVLSGWHEDRDFLDREGRPAVLSVAGRGQTFERLVGRYVGGGVKASTVLKDLLASGAVRLTREEDVRALRRSAAAGSANPATVQQLGEITAALLETFERNLTAGPEEQLAIRGVVHEASAVDLPMFRLQMGKRTDAFVETAQAYFDSRSNALNSKPAHDNDVLLGSFVFMHAQSLHEPEPRWQKRLAARIKKS